MADTEDIVDALTVNLPQLNWAAKIRGQRTPEIRPFPRGFMKQDLRLDPMSAEEVPAWQASHVPQFPIEPGKYGAQLAKDFQREFVPTPGESPEQTMYKSLQALFGVSVGGGGGAPGTLAAVKAKGGMWHPNTHVPFSDALHDRLSSGMNRRLDLNLSEETLRKSYGFGDPQVAIHAQDKALLDWTDKTIKNYLNKHAGTETDPLKDVILPHQLAEDGMNRWEHMTDTAIGGKQARMYQDERGLSAFPKVPPEETVWGIHSPDNYTQAGDAASALRDYMRHVGDHLKENVPPEQLQRYDLVRAVQETARRDAERAKKMNSIEGSREGTVLIKDYPDKSHWVEVGRVDKLPSEWSVHHNTAGGRDSWQVQENGKPISGENYYTSPERAEEGAKNELAKRALDREGSIMGHCVGSYCDLVNEGRTKIFSLRDPKGQSHVTIEVRPPDPRKAGNTPQDFMKEQRELGNSEILKKFFPQQWAGEGERKIAQSEDYHRWLMDKLPDIEQIKGKQNRSPEEKYHLYVQDFVKGGKWGDARELEGVGLTKWKGGYATGPELKLELDQRLLNYTLPDTKEGLFHRRHNSLDSAISTYKGGGHRAPGDLKRILRAIDRLYTGEAYSVSKTGGLVETVGKTKTPVSGYRDLTPEELRNLRREHGFND